MTCIVAVAHKGKVYIAGDSAGVAGLSLTVRADEKVFRTGDFLFGFCGSFRMGNLLRYKFVPPKQGDADDITYMNTAFVDAVRQCLKDGGFARKKDEAEHGGNFLVGYHGQIYNIESDYQVGLPALPFDAIGCGFDLALGAMYVTPTMEPRKRILKALKASEQFSAGVRAPFIIKSV